MGRIEMCCQSMRPTTWQPEPRHDDDDDVLKVWMAYAKVTESRVPRDK